MRGPYQPSLRGFLLALLAFALGGCGSSDDDAASNSGSGGSGGAGGGKCSVSALTCGDLLSADALAAVEPGVETYSESGHLPCMFDLPGTAGGIFQAFCGDDALLASQLATAEDSYPGATMETDTIGSKSFELIVGAPGAVGSASEVAAVTTSGKYVFDVSLTSGAADIGATRALAQAIDANLSKL